MFGSMTVLEGFSGVQIGLKSEDNILRNLLLKSIKSTSGQVTHSQTTTQDFFDPRTWTVAYAVWDHATQRAAVIDPVLDCDVKSEHPGLGRPIRSLPTSLTEPCCRLNS